MRLKIACISIIGETFDTYVNKNFDSHFSGNFDQDLR